MSNESPGPARVDIRGTTGSQDSRVFVLYTGGTIGMGVGADGSFAPLDLVQLGAHLPVLGRLPIGLTLASFAEPIDSSTICPDDWIAIADALVEHLPTHVGAVIMHGTDTMAFTASALSFLLQGMTKPIVLTGAQRSITELRSDARENLITSLEIAAGHLQGAPLVPEVTICFNDVLLRGNRSVKIHADSFRGFGSPNLGPLATAGVSLDYAVDLIRPGGSGPLRRVGGFAADVAAVRLHPGIDEAGLRATLSRPGLRGVVLSAYGAGNGPSASWFLDTIAEAVAAGVTVVVLTQCHAGSVLDGLYATGAALLATGAVAGADMTFEAALTKLMVLLDRHDDPTDVAAGMRADLAGELTVRGTG